MKYNMYLLAIAIASTQIAMAQNVGIGTNSPNASALLELQSTNKGLLLPRVADTGSITNPAKGLLVFANTSNKVWFYDGSRWQQATGAGGTDANWQLQGDSLVYTTKKYVSINTDTSISNPVAGLQATGNLLIQQPITYSKSLPTAAQTYTMNNTSSLQIAPSTDSTCRIFDPGGAGINYFNNMQGNFYISPSGIENTGLSVSFNTNDFGLATGDTLWLSQIAFPQCRDNYLYRFTNTSIAPSDINFSNVNSVSGGLFTIFRSNGDNINSKGFDITYKKLYPIQEDQNIRPTGNALAFNAYNGSLRSGAIATGGSIGGYSIALGLSLTASGFSSTAFGYATKASGSYSTAIGQVTTASGNSSTALGVGTEASGSYSTALGRATTARSYASMAMGQYNDSISSSTQNSWVATDPLLILGNGDFNTSRSNALVVYKNGNTDINGYTQLGKSTEGAPAIKMKKFTAVSGAAQTGSVVVPHGLNRAKIIGVQVLLNYGANVADIPSGYVDVPGYEYNWQVNDVNVWIINKNGNSGNILSKPVKILVTYEE